MKKTDIIMSINRTVNKMGLKVKKHSPEILIVTGVIGIVTSTVMACKATTKVGKITEKAKSDVDNVHYALEHPEEFKEKYTDEDGKKDLAIIYGQTAVQMVKLYAPSVILGALSISCVVASNHILHKRNIALAAAYATVDSTFKDYRKRVVERFGEELDKELRYNVRAKEVEETVVDEKGNETTVKRVVPVADDPNQYSDYARFFDETCAGWCKNAEYNKTFLVQQQNYANDLLKSRGHVFLNEVYDMLGMQRSQAGQIVGWIYDESEGHKGDNYIDFGIFDLYSERARSFVNGYEKSILLDFNVDGVIYDLMA